MKSPTDSQESSTADAHVRVEPAGKHLRISLGGQVIADTDRVHVVHEKGLPDRYYVPREDVRADLQDNPESGKCPWKGQWRYVRVSAGGKVVPNGAWCYFETTPVCDPIRGHVAFYPDKMDSFDWV